MPDHKDSLGGETFSGEEQLDPAEQSLGDQSTFSDANVDDELFDDGMEVVDLTTRYTEEGVLGKGGMGEVILATDTRLGRKVAIKRIIGKAARSKTAVARFLTEAKSMAELSHPNIVQIYDYGRATDGPFLIMECIQGGSLLEKCKAGPIELDEAINIFGQLCDGLAKAHAAGIIHRDIKPANVLMTEDGVPKLTDFGLAKDDTADTGMTMEGAVIGTLDFMPPEQRQAAELTDHRSDLWSLAATFYQMLTGKSPKVINIASLPPKLQSVVAKALEESKEDRFQSATEMREEILNVHSGKMDTSRSLGEGECPQCATTNASDNKHCDECGATLKVECLSCKASISIWKKACRDCGAQQAPLEDSLRQTLDGLKDRAQESSEEMNFSDAKDAANEILAQQHPRLLDHHDWARSFIDTTQAEEQRLTEFANGRYEEAKQHRKSFDYDAAIQAMKSIHPSLATEAMVQWNHTLIGDKTQGEELYAEIRTLWASEQYAGLLSKVDRLIELRGPKDSLTTLKGKLLKKEASIAKQTEGIRLRAQDLFSAGDLSTATHLLERIPIERRNDEDLHVVQQLAIASPILDQIREFVSQSKSNFDNFSSSVPSLLALVMQYIELVPKHDQINQLKKGLIKRVSENYQNYYTRETDVGFSDIPAEIRLLIPSELLNTYIKKKFRQQVRQLFTEKYSREFKDFEKLHMFPDLPGRKLANVLKSYAEGVSTDDILLLFDNTLLGSANDGFLMTDQAIYWHNANGPFKTLELTALDHVLCETNMLVKELYLNHSDCIKITHLKPVETVTAMLKEIVSIKSGGLDRQGITAGPEQNVAAEATSAAVIEEPVNKGLPEMTEEPATEPKQGPSDDPEQNVTAEATLPIADILSTFTGLLTPQDPVSAAVIEESVNKWLPEVTEDLASEPKQGPSDGPDQNVAAEATSWETSAFSKELKTFLQANHLGGHYYVGEEMPPKKLANIKEVYKLEPEEQIFAFIDCTVFGSAKDFVAITDRGIIGKCLFSKSRVDFEEFVSSELSEDGISILITKLGGATERIALGGSGLEVDSVFEFFENLHNKASELASK